LLVVFLGAFAIGRRVAAPIEQARQRQMDFTANASHELRTPLAVIQAQTSLALTHPRDADWYQRAFARVNEESKRMRVMVDDLLWLARFEAMPPNKTEPVDVAIMARQAADRFAAIAEARHQRLSVRLSGDSHVQVHARRRHDRPAGGGRRRQSVARGRRFGPRYSTGAAHPDL